MKKYVKLLGLAAVAAMALMAFLGAGSASATVLCKTTSTPCGAEWHYPPGTIWDASLDPGSTAVLESTGSGGLEDTCTESTVAGEQENTGSSSETVGISIKAVEVTGTQAAGLSFGNCTKPTKVLNPVGTLEFHWIPGSDNATVTATGFEVTVEAVSGVSCVYSAGAAPGTDLGTATGGSMGTFDVSAVVNKKSGSFLCPADSVWTASYTITDPTTPVYVETS